MIAAKKLLAVATGAPPPDTTLYVEDVFEIVTWVGDGVADRLIPTRNDLSVGTWLIWFRSTDVNQDNWVHTPGMGANKYVFFNAASSTATSYANRIKTLTSTGFTVGSGSQVNSSASTYVAWLFKVTPKFFDIVFYTGNGANRSISHSLDCVPGMILVKQLNTSRDWYVYHNGNDASTPQNVFNSTNAGTTPTTDSSVWNNTAPTTTTFSLGASSGVNQSSGSYMALLFAHDTTPESIIQCGQQVYSAGVPVTLGWEPQMVIETRIDTGDIFDAYDVVRGFSENLTRTLQLGNSNAEVSITAGTAEPLTKGFDGNRDNAGTIIYLAIRRELMRIPTDATKVFDVQLRAGTGAAATLTADWPVDMLWSRNRTGGTNRGIVLATRMRNHLCVQGAVTTAEAVGSPTFMTSGGLTWDRPALKNIGIGTHAAINESAVNFVDFLFRRAKGFFDIVVDVGTGSTHTIEHNLGVVPEIIIRRSLTFTLQERMFINAYPAAAAGFHSTTGSLSASTMWNSTAATDAVFTVGTATNTNSSGHTYQSLLFASCPGVCKIGTYVSNGAALNLTHDFASTPRMVMIKCISTATECVIYDLERGIVAGNDPFVTASSTAAETSSDTIDPYTGGITLLAGGANINVNTRTYVYMMIA